MEADENRDEDIDREGSDADAADDDGNQ